MLLGLANCYRCLSSNLAALYFWPDEDRDLRNAVRRLRALEGAGWIQSRAAFAKRLPRLVAPVVTWMPGQSMPEFGSISYHLKNRSLGSAETTRIYITTRLAAKRYGGSADRWPRVSETTHDLGLAQVYLELQETDSQRAMGWISEASIVSKGTVRGEKLPDAMVREQSGELTVIEFGGEYSKPKLTAFHQDCARKTRRYELW